jgi:hypothetical protein
MTLTFTATPPSYVPAIPKIRTIIYLGRNVVRVHTMQSSCRCEVSVLRLTHLDQFEGVAHVVLLLTGTPAPLVQIAVHLHSTEGFEDCCTA